MLTSLLGILACIVCLSSGTFAWFNAGSASSGNEIGTADVCLLEITVSDGITAEKIDAADAREIALGAGSYTVTLFLPKDSASGYLEMIAGKTVYRSDCIVRHYVAEGESISFTLVLNEARVVKFTSHWGIYSGEYDVSDGETLEIE